MAMKEGKKEEKKRIFRGRIMKERRADVNLLKVCSHK